MLGVIGQARRDHLAALGAFVPIATAGDLLIELIRRACFFEGAVAYRLDPTETVRVLGLVAPAPRSWASRAWSKLRRA